MTKRRYRLQERARQQEATRQRIVEATAALHAEVGPSATTISAIAERAGVQRLTVYRHFPDEAELYQACSAYNARMHPMPEPSLWQEREPGPARREAALLALYAYYEAAGEGLGRVLRDAEHLPPLREVLSPMNSYMEALGADLALGLEPADEPSDVRATIHLALSFWTWRTLTETGLRTADAARLMARLIAASRD